MSISQDEAVSALSRAYNEEVQAWADEYDEKIKDGDYDDRDEFIEDLEQSVDGAQRVIYTFRAKIGLLVSDNADIGIDELGAESFDWSSGIPYSQLMYFAFRQDIIEAMESDIDDDEVFEGEVFEIKLDNMDRDDGTVMVTVSGEGAAKWAKEKHQSIGGSRWEADGDDYAYAIIDDDEDLLDDLEEEGYTEIDDSEYTPPD